MLKEILTKATSVFVDTALDYDVKLVDSKPADGEFYASKIQISGEENYDFFIYIKKDTLSKMAYMFLFEENPNETMLQDLIKEIANVIVGKAKILASEQNINFDISTPDFVSNEATIPKQSDLELNFLFKDDIFSIIGQEK